MKEKNMVYRHVGKDLRNAPKSSTPHTNRGVPVFTSVSQKRRYITIAGIESDTSYKEHQWPTFALKELGDNASDYFKTHYLNATANERRIAIRVRIDDTATQSKVKILRLAVRNSNVNNIPVFQNLDGIFDYDSWVSTKRSQHRMTAGGLGDFLKRVLGMGYASWAGHDYKPEDSFEDKQWEEPVILRFNCKEYKIFLVVNNDNPLTKIVGPTTLPTALGIGADTEVEVALPLTATYWIRHCGSLSSLLLDNLEWYYKTFKLVKRNISFSFTREVA
jgi:hypothetical protein